ncbi:methyltransferase-like protein 22 isoform 2-T2 [Thomomys bottae]
MDEVTFRSDTVLSDVHLYTPNHRHLMVRLNSMGQPVFLSQFKLLWSRDSWAGPDSECARGGDVSTHEAPSPTPSSPGSPPVSGGSGEGLTLQAGQEELGTQLDEDGDLDVVRRPQATLEPDPAETPRDKVHPMILTQEEADGPGPEAPESCPHSIIQIDVGADLLAMCQRNVVLNSHLAAAGGGVVKVKELDWLKADFCTDPTVPFSWSEEDIADLYTHTTVLFAAEVFYDDDLTDALFNTLSRLVHRLKNGCTAILSVEKRFNFTLRHLDVTCEAYDHFRSSLQALEKQAEGSLRFVVEPVDASFPQLLTYERIRQLELWKIVAEPAL